MNQDEIQATYNVKDPIEILFDQIETGKESAIAGNSPFSDRNLSDMGVTKILAKKECTHAYCTWKRISANERTWVRF